MAEDNNIDAIPDEAKRALEEAHLRREKNERLQETTSPKPKEILGRKGPDPVRFGDWEKNGIISDF